MCVESDANADKHRGRRRSRTAADKRQPVMTAMTSQAYYTQGSGCGRTWASAACIQTLQPLTRYYKSLGRMCLITLFSIQMSNSFENR